jgi:Pyruvate/2-oxoacid:ferredoxin oxidoreductase delta subunit
VYTALYCLTIRNITFLITVIYKGCISVDTTHISITHKVLTQIVILLYPKTHEDFKCSKSTQMSYKLKGCVTESSAQAVLLFTKKVCRGSGFCSFSCETNAIRFRILVFSSLSAADRMWKTRDLACQEPEGL